MDTPNSLTAFSGGNTILNKSIVTDSKSLRLTTEPGNVRLRVIKLKSANFTLRVTVRPRAPLSSQCRQTLSISGVVLRRAVGSDGAFGEQAELPTNLGGGERPTKAARKLKGRTTNKPSSRAVDKAAEREGGCNSFRKGA
jgi:hypothetical protein